MLEYLYSQKAFEIRNEASSNESFALLLQICQILDNQKAGFQLFVVSERKMMF